MKHLTIILLIIASMLALMACSEDSDNGSNGDDDQEAWIGTWLSAGSNVAPILSTYFSYDSVRVTLDTDMTVKTESHVSGGAWSTVEGVYTVTKSESGDVHAVEFVYAAFSQEGIMQVTDDELKLEVVQTVPNIGATPRTPDTGFGSDVTLGTLNIQKYVRQ